MLGLVAGQEGDQVVGLIPDYLVGIDQLLIGVEQEGLGGKPLGVPQVKENCPPTSKRLDIATELSCAREVGLELFQKLSLAAGPLDERFGLVCAHPIMALDCQS